MEFKLLNRCYKDGELLHPLSLLTTESWNVGDELTGLLGLPGILEAACTRSFILNKNMGIVVTGVTYYLQAWVLEKKGPVFLGMMNPLATVIAVPASAICFGEVVSSGSIIGTFLLLGGLYSVLWGQSKEQKLQQLLITNHDPTSNLKGKESSVISYSGEAVNEINIDRDGKNVANST